MSLTRHSVDHWSAQGTDHGADHGADLWVEEFGHGLGPPTGVLVLRYPAGRGIPHFPEEREDHLHRVFWSPDGPLAVRRGAGLAYLPPERAFWARRGSTLEVSGCERQTVYVVCLRQAPAHLAAVPAGVVAIDAEAAAAVLALCRTELDHGPAMELKDQVLAGLRTPEPLEHTAAGNGLARQVAAALLSDPGDPTDLGGWAVRLHTTAKTLQRDFLREYGVPWSTWRTRTRLQASLALLGRRPVGEVAHRVGYSSASAYVSAFRRAYGTTPGQRARSVGAGAGAPLGEGGSGAPGD